jgi:hypothetical protein
VGRTRKIRESPHITPLLGCIAPMHSESYPVEVRRLNAARRSSVSSMELFHQMGRIDTGLLDPRVLLIPIALPPHQVLELASMHPTIQDRLYFILWLAFDHCRRRGGHACRPGKGYDGAGKSLTTWKTGWSLDMDAGRRRQ